jgi:peptidoglycan hydrolase-like protein with peptidoglycan-binding domain
VAISTVGVGTADADSYYPPGCAIQANDPTWTWSHLCYVGPNDWTTDHSAIGSATQILADLFYPTTANCNLVTSGEQSIKQYQLAKGLPADGVVGPNTYNALQGQTNFDYTSYGISTFGLPTEQNFYTVGSGPVRFDKWVVGGFAEPDNQWTVSFDGGFNYKWVGEYTC